MKKLFYLFVMITGMTLAVINANAQDPKVGCKAATTACCKSGDKKTCCKSGDKACCKKGTASACTRKDASATCQKGNNAKGTCCKSKAVAATDTKDSKSAN